MQDLYYDKFEMCFTTEVEPCYPPERIVKYFSDNGTGIVKEKHLISQDKYLTFEYPSEIQTDYAKVERMRIQFFKDNGIEDYDKDPHKYYTVELTLPEDRYKKILDQVNKAKEES